MTFEHILVAHNGPIVTVTLNRPDKRNALALGVMLEMIEAFA